MVKGKRRMIVFIGATIIEFFLGRLFGLDIMTSLSMVIIGNLIVAQWADMVYKGKVFK